MQHDPIRTLVGQLARLPGIGERTARRLVFHLLKSDRQLMHTLAEALVEVAEHVHECPRCCLVTTRQGECEICSDVRRDGEQLCVVSSVQDQAAIEATGEFRGRYHVLHGTLAPLDGIGPDALRVRELLARLGTVDKDTREIILATPPTIDGEATALYLSRQLEITGVRVSRIASGIPVGGELQFADRLTLTRALAERRTL